MVSPKHAFWQAFLAASLIFLIGIVFGFLLETGRATHLQTILSTSEIHLLDEQLRSRLLNELSIDCAIAKTSSFTFADTIYAEALQLEEYDSSSTFTSDLQLLHKRYDMLRMILWSENIALRNRCNSDFHTIVYLYNYTAEDPSTKAQQKAFSHLLVDLKEEYPENILLIPIAADANLASVDLALKKYNVQTLPAILVDERLVIDRIVPADQLRSRIFSIATLVN